MKDTDKGFTKEYAMQCVAEAKAKREAEKNKERFVYAVRDTSTNKLVAAKSNKSGKYYTNVTFANNRVNKMNSSLKYKKYELVTYKLVEIE